MQLYGNSAADQKHWKSHHMKKKDSLILNSTLWLPLDYYFSVYSFHLADRKTWNLWKFLVSTSPSTSIQSMKSVLHCNKLSRKQPTCWARLWAMRSFTLLTSRFFLTNQFLSKSVARTLTESMLSYVCMCAEKKNNTWLNKQNNLHGNDIQCCCKVCVFNDTDYFLVKSSAFEKESICQDVATISP